MKSYNNFLKLFEHLNQDEQYLYKYFKQDDNSKVIEFAFYYPYELEYFLSIIDYDDYNLSEKEIKEIENEEPIDAIQIFDDYMKNKDHEKFLIAYGEYLRDKADIDWYNIPSIIIYDYPERLKEEWLLVDGLSTDEALEIWRNGFEKGTDDVLTLHLGHKSEYGDFIKAKTVDDFNFYNVDNNRNNILMFRSSGVRVYNIYNQEYDVFFSKKSAHDIVWLEYGYSHNNDRYEVWYVESRKLLKRLVEYDDLDELVEWVEKHYDQYRKHLTSDTYDRIKERKAREKRNTAANNFNI